MDSEKKIELIIGRLNNGNKLRKYTEENIKVLAALFAIDLYKKNKIEYSKIDIYKFKEMGKSFASNIVRNIFQNDRDLFHKHFLQKYNIKFVPINRNFSETNIKQTFDDFLRYIKENNIKQRHPAMLEKYDMSFYNTVIQGKYNNNRNVFFKKYGYKRKEIGFYIKKITKINNKIRAKRVKGFIQWMQEREIKYFSPITISSYSIGMEIDFIRHFRTDDNKVDRLFILITFFKDPAIIRRFRHKTDNFFQEKRKYNIQTKNIEDVSYKLSCNDLNPEEQYIQEEQIRILHKKIASLNDAEQQLIKDFYAEKDINPTILENIICKLKIINPDI